MTSRPAHGAGRGDRRRQAVRHHPRAARRRPVDRGRAVPRARRPQRRGQVDPGLDPVRPGRAGRGDGAVRRRARAPRRRHRPLARVDRHRLPALDDRARPVGRRERLPRQHLRGWSAGGRCARGPATSCASGASTSTPRTPCRELSVEQLQIVEIARALARGARCVLLDEPTAALEREAGRRLFDRVRQLTAGGVAVLYISHHLEEVFEICQDVAVLRDGELVLTAPTPDLARDDLVARWSAKSSNPVHRTVRGSTGRPTRLPAPAADPGRRSSDVVLSVDGPRPPTRPAAACPACRCRCTAGRGRRRHRPAERGRRHPRPGGRRAPRTAPAARSGCAGRRVPARAARRRPARRDRLHPRGPPRRGLRLAPRRGRERDDDDHQASWPTASGVLQPGRRAGGRRGPAHRAGCRWCRPAPASRSASCPAATSRRSPSRGRWRTTRR